MAANPFLFTEDDYTSPHSTTSNPFLVDESFQDGANGTDNPFLFQTTDVAQNSTNPFAFDPSELETSEPQAPFVPYSFESTIATETVVNSDHNFFSLTENTFGDTESNIPQKPTDLDLKYTNTIAGPNDHLIDEGNESGSRGEPPPRPPPSKETQDLLMSVMGAMDATSSHLLDRIPPTRTPSPVSVRDVQSPSPTPEPSFGDLLDVSDAKPSTDFKERKNEHSDDLLMSLAQDDSCDINQNVSSTDPIKPQPEQIRPSRPAPPARPPRPQPPQKPPPPTFTANQTNASVLVQPPPKPPAPAALPPQKVETEDLDLLGNEGTAFQKPKASTADILNLYKSETQVTDLLFDTVETVVEKPPLQITKPESLEPLTHSKTPTPTESMPQVIQEPSVNITPENIDVIGSAPNVQDNFISPENTSDLHIDVSDTQTKDFVSSVTFNPFSANEDIQEVISPQIDIFQNNNKNSTFNTHNTLLDNNVFSPSPPKDIIPVIRENTSGDDFDAFAQKFESAAKEEVKNGAFDAFCNEGNDTWGSNMGAANDFGGFEADEPFDSFLAMQEPPAVPQSTPSRLTRAGSEDSDEDKDFSVFIK